MQSNDSVSQNQPRSLDGTLRKPNDIPKALPVKALFLLRNGVYLTGLIARDGLPRIYAPVSKRHMIREDWEGIAFWMMLPD